MTKSHGLETARVLGIASIVALAVASLLFGSTWLVTNEYGMAVLLGAFYASLVAGILLFSFSLFVRNLAMAERPASSEQ
jgi:hypothetical protein